MYHDYYLKFKDAEEANEVLFTIVPSGFPTMKTVPGTKYLVKGTAEYDFEDYTTFDPPEGAEVLDSWPEDQEIVDPDAPPQGLWVPRYAAVDVIGTIYKPTGKVLKTPEGPVDEMKPLPGWHVNVRHTAEAPELDAYKVEVKTPSRMWA
jgi:hypothetical protein